MLVKMFLGGIIKYYYETLKKLIILIALVIVYVFSNAKYLYI